MDGILITTPENEEDDSDVGLEIHRSRNQVLSRECVCYDSFTMRDIRIILLTLDTAKRIRVGDVKISNRRSREKISRHASPTSGDVSSSKRFCLF